MSARFSPDGMYYWDGAAWRSTVSPDGRYRWDGAAWVPLQHALTPVYGSAQSPPRQPTSWTRPLQYAVGAWYAISAGVSLSIPFWMSGQMTQMMQDVIAHQQAQNPDLQPPPQSFYDALTTMVQWSMWIGAILGVAFATVLIVGTVRRWTWVYFVVLALLGLGVVSGPADLLNLVSGGSAAAYGYQTPVWILAIGIVSWFPSTALFVAMLIALVKRGTWGMVRATPGATPAA